MSEALISVIIPFYSGVDWLQEAVESVMAQTYKNKEIIVINDGSKESLLTFFQQYENDIVYVEQTNAGAAAARNTGIEMSKGQYVAFLDSDDLWEPDKLTKQLAFMIESELVWSHSSYTKFGDNIESELRDLSNFKGSIYPKCLSYNPIATPTVVIKKTALDEDNTLRFAVGMKSGEDSIFWLQLSKKFMLGVIEEPLVKVRIRGNNAALRAYAQLRAKAQIWDQLVSKNIIHKSEVKILVRGAFLYCCFAYKLLDTLLKSEKNEQKKSVEVLAKMLYLLPWLIFRSQR